MKLTRYILFKLKIGTTTFILGCVWYIETTLYLLSIPFLVLYYTIKEDYEKYLIENN